MSALLLGLVLWVQDPPLPPPVAEQAPRAPIFLRTPADLPRSQEGAWDSFLAQEETEQILATLGDEFLERIADAERAYRGGRYPAALEGLYQALEQQPDFPPALMLLGTAYFRLRRYEDSRLALERFCEVAPGDLWRTQALGHCHYSLGDYPLALSHYEAVLAAMPEALGPSPEALRGLALCHMRLDAPDRALELLGQVLELRPDHGEAYTFMARILHDEERLEQALLAADRARELDAFEPQPWFLTMRILFDLGREEEALATQERWKVLDAVAQQVRNLEGRLRFTPGRYSLILRLCELHAEVGDVASLRARFADLLAARPADVAEVEVRILVLDVLYAQGDHEGARVAAVALEQRCPEELEAWRRLERFYAEQRDRVNQVRCTQEILRLSPGD